ncbi:amino acid ABC transporter permease [Enterococcus faecalis]
MNYFGEILPALLQGAGMTLKVFFFTLLGAIPLGIFIAFVLQTRFKPLRYLIDLYIWLMRGTPLLLQLIFVFYGLPLIGLVFERYDAAIFAFILNYAAYFAEIFRGGIAAIPQGQYEAAKVLRLTPFQTVTRIILPQVIKIVLPSIGNEVINLVKDTSLIYVIGLGDLLRAGKIAMSRDVTLLPLVLVGTLYLLFTAILTFAVKKFEKFYQYYK